MRKASFRFDFKIVATKSFEKSRKKEFKKFPKIAKKLKKSLKSLKNDPFQGKRIQSFGERRIWVGKTHRLFYDIEGSDIVLLQLKKKDKGTYRN